MNLQLVLLPQSWRRAAGRLFGKQDFSGRDARRERGWGISLAPSFLSLPAGQEPSELPLTFRLRYPAPQWLLMKPEASGQLFIPDWKQRSNSACVGCWPRKRKMVVKKAERHIEMCLKSTLCLVSSMCKMDRQGNQKMPHWATERKTNNVASKRSDCRHKPHT